MRAVDFVVIFGWAAFWLYWLAAAVGVKHGRTRLRFGAVRLVIAVIVIVLLRTRVVRAHMTHDPWLVGIGLALFTSGLCLAVWARVHLGRNWGQPMSQKDEPELVTTGPYRWIRNPIYSGLILAMIGTAIAVSPYWLVAAAVLGGYFVYSAFMEQRFMAAQFPDRYPAYKQSTKMLVPFLF